MLAPLLLVSGIAAIALVELLPDAAHRPLPTIPWSSPTQNEQFDFYRDLLTHPLTIALVLLAIVTLSAAALLVHRLRDPDRRDEGWAPVLFGDPPPGSIAAAARAAWLDHAGVSAALIAGLVIFAALFTTLFTNLYGLASGTIATDGTLLYWLGQHNVRRGEQPWFYFLLLMPQYELIAVLFGVTATIIAGVRALLVGIGRATPGPRFVFQTFLAIWFIGIFLALSWAGEKMPWLVTHIALPATLLAAALLGEAWERWRPVASGTGEPVRAPWVGRAAVGALRIAARVGSLLVSRGRAHDLWRVRLRRGRRRLGTRADLLGSGALVVVGVATSRRQYRGRPDVAAAWGASGRAAGADRARPGAGPGASARRLAAGLPGG